MAIPTANGLNLLNATIEEPRVGRWTATITVDIPEGLAVGEPGDAIVLDFEDGEVTFTGTIVRGDEFAGVYSGLITGGAGGLATQVDAKAYVGVPMAIILADLMVLTGETLDGTTAEAVTSFVVPTWQRTSGLAQNAIDAIRTTTGADWRILRTGTLLLGTDTFPALDFEFQEIDQDPAFGSVTIAPDDGVPRLLPAVTFDGTRIEYVTTSLSPSSLTQTYLKP